MLNFWKRIMYIYFGFMQKSIVNCMIVDGSEYICAENIRR